MALKIGEVAEAAGVNVQTVRYYERRGLLEEPPRTPTGYRQYEPDAVDRIRFIQRARAKQEEVRRKIRELQRLEEVLGELISACEARSPTGACPILDALEVRTGGAGESGPEPIEGRGR